MKHASERSTLVDVTRGPKHGYQCLHKKGMMSFKNFKIIHFLKNMLNVDLFQGKHLHSRDYKDYQGFENKRVVVIGLGNSGGHIAVELGICAKQVRIAKFPLIFIQLLIFNSIC